MVSIIDLDISIYAPTWSISDGEIKINVLVIAKSQRNCEEILSILVLHPV